MTNVLIKRGNLDTETDKHRGRQCEETQGECRVKAKEFQRPLVNHRKLGERPVTDAPSPPSEGTNSADTLILDF